MPKALLKHNKSALSVLLLVVGILVGIVVLFPSSVYSIVERLF